jgi:hypothetical protein
MLSWDPPIRVSLSDASWRVADGSSMDGYYASRAEAVAKAMLARARENRDSEIEPTRHW